MRFPVRAILVAALATGAGMARAESPVTTGGESFRLNGYTSFEFERRLGDDGGGDEFGSFDADLFDLVLNWRANEHLRVAADLTWEHGAASEDSRGNVALEYGWVEYSVNDLLRVRAGKMFTPFGIYNEIHTAKPATLTVKEPFSTNRTDKWGTAARLYPRWQVGVELLGNGSSPIGDWDYAVAVSNGEQLQYDGEFDLSEEANPFEEDVNTQKAITARVRLATVGNVQVGLSGYFDAIRVFDPDAGEFFAGTLQQTAYGLSLQWTPTELPIGIEAEVVSGNFTPTHAFKSSAAALSIPLDSATSIGATAMVYWRATDSLTPYVRYEYLDLDDDRDDDATSLLLAGVNLRVAGGLVLKVEGDYTMAQKDTAYGEGDDAISFFELKAAAVVGF